MRAEARSRVAGGDGELEDRRTVAGHLGVLRQPRIGPRRHRHGPQPIEHLPVQSAEPTGGDAGQHRLPDELVPERVRRRVEPQHPGGDALVDRVRRDVGHPMHEVRLDPRPDHGSGLQRAVGLAATGDAPVKGPRPARSVGGAGRPRRRPQSRRRRCPPSRDTRPHRRSQSVQRASDSCLRQQWHFDSTDDRLRRDVTEHHAQRIGRVEMLVAIRGDHQDWVPSSRRRGSAAGRASSRPPSAGPRSRGPTGRRLEGGERGFEEPVPLARAQQLADCGIEPRCDVDQRTKRPRRGQRVARSPHHQGRRLDSSEPLPNERGLPDTGLAVYEDKPSGPLERLVVKARSVLRSGPLSTSGTGSG